jgi:hypothetical protein
VIKIDACAWQFLQRGAKPHIVRLWPKHWWSYLAAAQGLRSYDVLGSWRQTVLPT